MGKTFHPNKKKLGLLISSVILVLLIAFIAVSVIKVKKEQIYHETWTINKELDVTIFSFAELDQAIRSDFPEYCTDMQLVGATAEFSFSDSMVFSEQTVLTYYRYIDESMEGGNIEANECYIDLTSKTLLRVEHWYGSGRSYPVYELAISGGTINTPLDQYVNHISELISMPDGVNCNLVIRYSNTVFTVEIHNLKTGDLLYVESLIQWPANNVFRERIYEKQD